MKFYVQMFLISMIVLKGVLISMYLFHHNPPPLFTGSVALALEPGETAKIDSSSINGDQTTSSSAAVAASGDNAGEPSVGEKKKAADQLVLIEEREKFLNRKEQRLLALQEEINKRLEDLTRLRDEIRESMAVKKTVQEKQVKHLIKIYSTMKPQKVAELIEKLDIDLITELFSRMKGDVVGQILSFVDTDTGAKITQGLFPADLEEK